jgi:hypothetical protein
MDERSSPEDIKTVEEYIADLEDWRGAVVSEVRDLILEVAPDAQESIKWSRPVYEDNGSLAYIVAFKHHVNLGFSRGAALTDEAGVLEGTGKEMRHVKLTGPEDVQRDVLRDLLRQAVALNRPDADSAADG